VTENLAALSLPSQDKKIELPQRVIVEAIAKGINLATVKLEQGQWVACVDGSCSPIFKASEEEVATYGKPEIITGLNVGDELIIMGHQYKKHVVEAEPNYGIIGLGSFSTGPDGKKTFTPAIEFKGSVSTAKKDVNKPPANGENINLPAGLIQFNYSDQRLLESQKSLSNIRNRILGEPGTSFVIVVSVPNECLPCRRYKPAVEQAANKAIQDDQKIVFVVLNFESFSQATKVTGASRFPTTVFFPAAASATPFTDSSANDWQIKPLLKHIPRPGYMQLNAIESGLIRTHVEKGLAVSSQLAERGIFRIVNTLADFINLAQ
jgi:thiol-disulfide isomerase/thioredoxin